MSITADWQVLLLPGDGVGPEVTDAAELVLKVAAEHVPLRYTRTLIGGASLNETGQALNEDTLHLCSASDAVLLGAVGGPQWNDLPAENRPEYALLTLRRKMKLFANLRPVKLRSQLLHASPLREENAGRGVDIMVVRELGGGLYYGPRGTDGTGTGQRAYDTLAYTRAEIQQVVREAFRQAHRRNRSLTSVDKANVLETSRLWRDVVNETAPLYPDVDTEHLYVDNCAMQLVLDPARFDVVVTENTFGDILSDLGGALAGSIGMLPSVSISRGDHPCLYEPVHGSAPEIAGQGIANPLGAILSVQMMLDITFGREDLAQHLDEAIDDVLEKHCFTRDIAQKGVPPVSTGEMARQVADRFAARIQDTSSPAGPHE